MHLLPLALSCLLVGQLAAAPQSPPAKRAQPPKLDMAVLKALFGNDPPAPASKNELTADKVALGKLLYHEQSLSKGGDMSCASCHDLTKFGQDGKATSPGSDGKGSSRNTPTTINAARHFKAMWDGRADDVEAVVGMSLTDPQKLGLADEAAVVAKVHAKPELVEAFGKAFGRDQVTLANVQLAVGAYLRKLVTKSPFDEFLDGNKRALSTEQQLGLKSFIDIGCATCHGSRLLGGQMMQKIGLFEPFPSEDPGRAKVTGNEAERHFFKVPSLLNVEQTAPYNHDGKAAALDEVVRTMARIQLNKKLTDEEVASVVTFLKALNGKLPEDAAAR